jgi:heat shock protein HtpX
MTTQDFKTFWDIEKEKTWRIYILFGFLFLLYFFSVFVVWLIIKFFIYLRISLMNPRATYEVFGSDTLIVLIIAVVAALIHWYFSNNNVVNKILSLLNAKHPDKYDKYHHIFQNVVDEIETSAGGSKVERYILPTGAMNAFALADLAGRKIIGITEGLLSRLSRDELQGVVAHEMVHILSDDCLQTTMACSLFNIYSETLAQLSRIPNRFMTRTTSSYHTTTQRDALAFGIITIPILIVLFITDLLSHLLNMFISRQREYRADASAVKLTRNPLAFASALYKIGTHWRGAGYSGERLSPIFILSPQFSHLEETENLAATLFSTHPPLIKRLQVILNLAHADLEQITDHLQKSKKIKTEPEKIKPVMKFLVEHNNEWLGPYTILQLQTLDWLNPGTKLRIDGSDDILNASEIPALNYFFQKRDEPIWKMKRLCPICRQWLIVQSYEGLYVWRCAFCNGMLAEHDKLPRIFVRKEKGFTGNVQRLATLLRKDTKQKHPRFKLRLDTLHPRPCPKCGKPMMRKFYSYAFHVEIDECSICALTWFDADELEILQCLIEMEED